MNTRKQIDDFLAQKRLAVVGISRQDKDFSRLLYTEFRRRGYDVVPVNPRATQLEGQPCFARLQDIEPAVGGALLLTTPQETERVVRDCAQAGIRRVWMHRGAGRGAVSQAAIEFCQANGIDVIPGYCPFMFFPQTGWVHRLHGWIKRLTGGYPR